MKVKLFAVSLSLLSVQAFSQFDPFDPYEWAPPVGCKEGKVYEGTVNLCFGECPDGSGGSNDLDYLKAESKTFLAIDWSTKIKGDGAPYFSDGDTVHFYDSLGGFRGEDEANFEGNAYLTYDVTGVQRFDPMEGWVWVMKNLNSDYPWCSKKKVYFHNAPAISTSVVNEEQIGNRIEGKIKMYGYQDSNYSKNALEGMPPLYHVQRKVISRWTGKFCDVVEESTEWANVLGNSVSSSFTFSLLDCQVQYRMRSFDGTYYSLWSTRTITNSRGGSSGSSSSGGSSSSSSGGSSSGGGGSCGKIGCDIEP